MICQFCQQDFPTLCYFLNEQVVCIDCDEWIVSNIGSLSGGFGRVTDNGKIIRLWHTFGRIPYFESVSIYFQYDVGTTVIVEHFDVGDRHEYMVLLTLNSVLPVTRQLLQDVPKKLKLWVTFS